MLVSFLPTTRAVASRQVSLSRIGRLGVFVVRNIQNFHLSNLNKLIRKDYQYRFNGELLSMRITKKSGTILISTKEFFYQYDHAGRKISYLHNGKPIVRYFYDNIGRLQSKKFSPAGTTQGSKQTGNWTDASSWLSGILPTLSDNVIINSGQTLTIPSGEIVSAGVLNDKGILKNFGTLNMGKATTTDLYVETLKYHIRGFLRGINLDANNNLTSTLFSYKLAYEEGTNGYFDGNIRNQYWKSNIDGVQRAYEYSYDGASRLTGATYAGKAGENYALNAVSYDFNGNITKLGRKGATNSTFTSFNTVDSLKYTYQTNSNKLSNIQDLKTGNIDVGDFRDGTNTDDDYDYWADGSLKRDRNKGIDSIQYNYLKLPERIKFANGRTITTEYDAEGTKLKKIDSNGETTDYEEDDIYVNGKLYQTSHDEGRIVNGVYEYNINDHLGNLRVAFRDSLGIAVPTQSIFYDSWGLSMKGMSITRNPLNFNKFQFLNRETQFETSYIDLQNRQYDPQRGQMTSIDVLAELSRRFSPFVYGNDNPIRFIDPDGMAAESAFFDSHYEKEAAQDEFKKLQDKDKGKKKEEVHNKENGKNVSTSSIVTKNDDKVSSKANISPALPVGWGVSTALRGAASYLGMATASFAGAIALAFTMEGDRPREDDSPIRIALGVDAFLNDFSAKVMALPLKAGYIEQFDEKETIIASIMALGQKPNVTFHFNLSTLNGKVNDPFNLSHHSDKVTTAEFLTVMSLFKDKTTFYVKSGTIYKPITVK